MKHKKFLLLAFSLIAGLVLAACQPEVVEVTRVVTETETITETITEEVQVEVTRVVEGEVVVETVTEQVEVEVTRVVEVMTEDSGDGGGVSEFHTAWPYTPPPAGHFNSFVSDNLNLSIYHHLMHPSLFYYVWHDQSWVPMAGDSWEWDSDGTVLRAHLHEGAVWSDGSAFTSQDVVDTFHIRLLLGSSEWEFMTEIVAVDESTVEFRLAEPSTTFPTSCLDLPQWQYSSVIHLW